MIHFQNASSTVLAVMGSIRFELPTLSAVPLPTVKLLFNRRKTQTFKLDRERKGKRGSINCSQKVLRYFSFKAEPVSKIQLGNLCVRQADEDKPRPHP